MIFVSFLYSACRGILIGASGVWMRDISRNTSRCFKPAVVDERVCIAFRRALSYKPFQFVVFMRNIANAALGRGREWSDRWILSMVAYWSLDDVLLSLLLEEDTRRLRILR